MARMSIEISPLSSPGAGVESSDLSGLVMLAAIGLGIFLWSRRRQQPLIENLQKAETWEWTDAHGNHRTMAVHRDGHTSFVKQSLFSARQQSIGF